MVTVRVSFPAKDGQTYSAVIEVPAEAVLERHVVEVGGIPFMDMPLFHHGAGYHTHCSRGSDDRESIEVDPW